MTKLKSIALELLQKYEESETSVIWEFSGDIAKSEENLAVEVAKYRELIDKYAEQEPFGPCDLCRFNPPSSADGKPCTMCPAERRTE